VVGTFTRGNENYSVYRDGSVENIKWKLEWKSLKPAGWESMAEPSAKLNLSKNLIEKIIKLANIKWNIRNIGYPKMILRPVGVALPPKSIVPIIAVIHSEPKARVQRDSERGEESQIFTLL
jgi:hypothetical protein